MLTAYFEFLSKKLLSVASTIRRWLLSLETQELGHIEYLKERKNKIYYLGNNWGGGGGRHQNNLNVKSFYGIEFGYLPKQPATLM